MAPEGMGKSGYFSGRKYDVWSLGITFYCCIFGRLPYDVSDKSQASILQAIQDWNGFIADDTLMHQFLATMLKKDPA